MKNFVITIARGYGSGGRVIGRELSKRLGIPCYDDQILKMASELSGINKNKFVEVDERLRGSSFLRKLSGIPSASIVGPSEEGFVSDVNLFNYQAQIIKNVANRQSCIIIGKCANHILKDYGNVVSVYIEAPRKACVKIVLDLLDVTEDEANKMIYQTDRYRADYYKYYSGGEDWTNPVLYDMTLNSYRIGRERCVEVIIDYLKIKYGEDVLKLK